MDDYGKFVYLDVQKSGSTFVTKFLKTFSSCHREDFLKHGRIRDNYRESATYFISVRHPLEQYKSLYRYGSEGKGALYNCLVHHGRKGLYASDSNFENWLTFILDPENSHLLGEQYEPRFARLYGLQTFRFLALSFRKPVKTLSRVKTYEELLELYESEKIHTLVLRNEQLNDDLTVLVRDLLPDCFTDTAKALAYLRQDEKVNSTSSHSRTEDGLSAETLQLLCRRERFLFEKFYAQDTLFQKYR